MSPVPTSARTVVALLASCFLLTVAVSLSACSAGSCTGDNDCPLQRVCDAGACVISCAFDATACGAGEVCVGGHCQTACTSDDDCPSGTECGSAGVCLSVPPEPDTDRPGGDDVPGGDDGAGGDDGGGDEVSGGDSATE